MTITYQYGVSSGTVNGFTKLLFRWKGSVYKLIYKELLIFIAGYVLIRIVYRSVLNEFQKNLFEQVALYCAEYIDLIPLSFVLGFYVTFVVQRWWTQFITIPFPDRLLNTVIIYIEGNDERGQLMRRTLMRYWNLLFVLMMMSISTAVKKRFPTVQHLLKAGYMTQNELDIYKSINVSINTFWIPTNWFLNVLTQCRNEGRINSDTAIKHIVEELNEARDKLKLLWCHDWVTLPLVYTQVVTWATHLFFVISLIGRQYLDPTKKYKGHEVDFYVPFFTIIQFLFYMGWLKVAEELINPFGSDDDDIEVNWLIDRHLLVSYLAVEDVYRNSPTLQNISPFDENLSEKPNPTFTQIGQDISGYTMHVQKSRNKFSSLFGRCCSRSTGEANMPRMVGKPDFLLCNKSLAMLNEGSWKFSQDQIYQNQSGSIGSTLDGQIIANLAAQIEEKNKTMSTNSNKFGPNNLALPSLMLPRRNTFHVHHGNNTAPNTSIQAVVPQEIRANSLRTFPQYLNPSTFLGGQQIGSFWQNLQEPLMNRGPEDAQNGSGGQDSVSSKDVEASLNSTKTPITVRDKSSPKLKL